MLAGILDIIEIKLGRNVLIHNQVAYFTEEKAQDVMLTGFYCFSKNEFFEAACNIFNL